MFITNNDIAAIRKRNLETKIKFFGLFLFLGKVWLILVLSLIPISLFIIFQKNYDFQKSVTAFFDPGFIFVFIIFFLPPLGIIFLCKRIIIRTKKERKRNGGI